MAFILNRKRATTSIQPAIGHMRINKAAANGGQTKQRGSKVTAPVKVTDSAKVTISKVTAENSLAKPSGTAGKGKVVSMATEKRHQMDAVQNPAQPNPAQPNPAQPPFGKPAAITLKTWKGRGSVKQAAPQKQLRPTVPSPFYNDVFAPERKGSHRRPNGRPSKYRDEYPQMMFDFFNKELYCEIETKSINSKGMVCNNTTSVLNTFPTFSRFASTIGVTRDTLHRWAKGKRADGTLLHPEFSDTYTRAKDFQAALLIEGGLSGAYNSRFVCQLARCILGWKHNPAPQVEVTINSKMTAELDEIYTDGMKIAMDMSIAI
jgi:hypothetical protein